MRRSDVLEERLDEFFGQLGGYVVEHVYQGMHIPNLPTASSLQFEGTTSPDRSLISEAVGNSSGTA